MADQTVTGTNFVEVNLSTIIKGASFGAINFNVPERDYSGAEIDIWFRQSNANGRIILKISEVAGITIVDATNFSIDKFTMTWAAGTYYFDTRELLASGDIKKTFCCTFKVKEDGTNE